MKISGVSYISAGVTQGYVTQWVYDQSPLLAFEPAKNFQEDLTVRRARGPTSFSVEAFQESSIQARAGDADEGEI